jgi:hypothetical protein
MPRSELDFHVYHPELCELPARANSFNAAYLVEPHPAPAVIPNPALPALPLSARSIAEAQAELAQLHRKIGDTLNLRPPEYDDEFGDMAAEKEAYDQWLKQREAGIRAALPESPRSGR